MDSVQRLALSVEQLGRNARRRVSTTEVAQAKGDSGIDAQLLNNKKYTDNLYFLTYTFYVMHQLHPIITL